MKLFSQFQGELIEGFNPDGETTTKEEIQKVKQDIMKDFSSISQKAIAVESFYRCQLMKEWKKVKGIDLVALFNSKVKNTILEIPLIDQCNICVNEYSEIAHEISGQAIAYITNEVGHFEDIYLDPDEIDESRAIEVKSQAAVSEELAIL